MPTRTRKTLGQRRRARDDRMRQQGFQMIMSALGLTSYTGNMQIADPCGHRIGRSFPRQHDLTLEWNGATIEISGTEIAPGVFDGIDARVLVHPISAQESPSA